VVFDTKVIQKDLLLWQLVTVSPKPHYTFFIVNYLGGTYAKIPHSKFPAPFISAGSLSIYNNMFRKFKKFRVISTGVLLVDYAGSYLNPIKTEAVYRILLLGPQRSALLLFFFPRIQANQFIYSFNVEIAI
jgi:hypothetical protein